MFHSLFQNDKKKIILGKCFGFEKLLFKLEEKYKNRFRTSSDA